MRSVLPGPTASTAPPAAPLDLRARRRAARRAENRTEILDSAEQVFGEHGIRDGSLREIALRSGFSTGAIYLFFDNKQHLLSDTLIRRGAELIERLQTVAESGGSPLEKLHRIVDVTVDFFDAHPDFRRLLRHMNGGTPIIGPVLAEPGAADGSFTKAMNLLGGLVADGQKAGEIRAGDASAIAHLYSVLVNEHVFLAADDGPTDGALTAQEFHALVNGMLSDR